jgi:hypothetical protein
MTIHPKQHKDLVLAPVASEIDINLQRMRDESVRDVEATLELELDRPAMTADRDERAELVLRQALRNVDMHGWRAAITSDGCRVHLDGGSVSIDLGLSANIAAYIHDGVKI